MIGGRVHPLGLVHTDDDVRRTINQIVTNLNSHPAASRSDSTIPLAISFVLTAGQTSYTASHGFNTRDVHATVIEASGSYREIYPAIDYPTINTVRVQFTAATAVDYRLIVSSGFGGGADS